MLVDNNEPGFVASFGVVAAVAATAAVVVVVVVVASPDRFMADERIDFVVLGFTVVDVADTVDDVAVPATDDATAVLFFHNAPAGPLAFDAACFSRILATRRFFLSSLLVPPVVSFVPSRSFAIWSAVLPPSGVALVVVTGLFCREGTYKQTNKQTNTNKTDTVQNVARVQEVRINTDNCDRGERGRSVRQRLGQQHQ